MMMCDALSRLLVPGTDSDVADSYAMLADRARDAVFGFEDELAIVDIETTGFDPARDRIVEIAAAIVHGPRIVERFSTLVDPGRPVPVETTKLTGIDDAMIRGAPSAEAAVAQLAAVVAGRDVVAHNVSFDRAFLSHVGGRSAFPGAWIDSLQLSRIALPRLRSHRLRDLADAFGSTVPSHRAADDVEALAFLWRVLLCGLDALPGSVVGRIATLAPEAEWPLRGVLAHHAAGRRSGALDLKALRRGGGTGAGPPLDDAEEVACIYPAAERVTAEFSEGGLASRMYDGYEERVEQTRMAEAIAAAFASRTHLAVEAGTGVGKSVAYLVPSALFAVDNNVGVGVATKTNSLADQLIYHELPQLNAVLGGVLRYVSLKGYEHYPCLRKLERFASELPDDADEDLIASAAALLAWVAQSPWGDLDGVNLHWRRDLRSSIQATQADCTRKRCRFYPNLCYLHGVRRRAASAHIVVTNHALLFRDMVSGGGILPPARHWVVDEAHSAEGEARKQLTFGASHVELSVVLSALHGSRGGLLDALSRTLRTSQEAIALLGLVDRMKDQATRAATLTDSLFDFVKDMAALAPDSGYDAAELRLTPTLRDSGPWGTVSGVGRSLLKRLDALVADGRELITGLEAAGADVADARADLAGLLARLAEQQAGLALVLEGAADEYVYSVALDRRRTVDVERLRAAPLDVGEVLAEGFYPRCHSVVFTSATIATGDDFSHFARSVGLDHLPEASWQALRLPSSYDFDAQMSVYVPTDLAEPGTRDYLGDLEGLIEAVHRAMGGSVLTLFTNRREMETLYDVVAPRLEADGMPVLLQGRGVSAKRLRDEFLADQALSLFATKSFWEGFDAKGDTLRCVIVPRLPFGQMGDPLYQERRERDALAWAHHYLPEAVIELKQAAGRLIRSRTDTGCLVIADSRAAGGRRYSRDFLRALPVEDVETIPTEDVVASIARRFQA